MPLPLQQMHNVLTWLPRGYTQGQLPRLNRVRAVDGEAVSERGTTAATSCADGCIRRCEKPPPMPRFTHRRLVSCSALVRHAE